ncbi:MAG: PrsW family glutamic-type intramembrane protease [Candidatus Aminicenantes bacterium]
MARVKNFSKSGILNVGFQVIFLIVLYLVGSQVYLSMKGIGGNILLFVLVLIPSAIWTLFFYFQDRIEPEPASYVLVSFLAGMAGTTLLIFPLEKSIFKIDSWLFETKAAMIIGSIFVIGTVTSFLFYLVIRYGFYGTAEFDEPVDGMVYGAFVGSGFAFVKSLTYLSAHPEFTLFSIAYTSTTNILIYASIGSLVGYIIGRVKFVEKKVQPASILAVVVGTILIGLYHILNEFVYLTGLRGAIWLSFFLTLIFAVAILVFVYFMMRKLTEKPLHKKVDVKVRPDYLVFALVIVFLVVGGTAKNMAMQDAGFEDDDFGIAFKYRPHRLSLLPSSGLSPIGTDALFSKTVFRAAGDDEGEFIFSVKVKEESIDPSGINTLNYTGDVDAISFFVEESEVGGKKGVHLRYSYVDESQLGAKEFPPVHWICMDIIPSKRFTYVFSLQANPKNFERTVKIYEQILKSIHWINQ